MYVPVKYECIRIVDDTNDVSIKRKAKHNQRAASVSYASENTFV